MKNVFYFLAVSFILQTQQFLSAQSKEPILFAPGIINTGEYESHPAFSPNGETLYFLKCTPDINYFCSICVSHLKNGKWSEPIVAPFSGQYYDIDPFVSADGKILYFASNRPVQAGGNTKTDSDIWKIPILSNGWGKPEHLEGEVNSAFDEYYPTTSDNGNLYFGSTRPGKGGSDIFKSIYLSGKFQTPVNLGDSINTANSEYEPFIAADESYLIFMSTRPGGLANADFYLSYIINGKWSQAKKVPEPVSSPYTDWSPKVTHDKKYFFFSSTRSVITVPTSPMNLKELKEKVNRVGNGLGDIYFIDASFINKH
jgi:Tol biopolymer transport system component